MSFETRLKKDQQLITIRLNEETLSELKKLKEELKTPVSKIIIAMIEHSIDERKRARK